jgi:hypothetical protein
MYTQNIHLKQVRMCLSTGRKESPSLRKLPKNVIPVHSCNSSCCPLTRQLTWTFINLISFLCRNISFLIMFIKFWEHNSSSKRMLHPSLSTWAITVCIPGHGIQACVCLEEEPGSLTIVHHQPQRCEFSSCLVMCRAHQTLDSLLCFLDSTEPPTMAKSLMFGLSEGLGQIV